MNTTGQGRRVKTWKSADERRAQGEVGYPLAQFVEQRHGVKLGRSVHAKKGHVGDVLQRDVDVLAHLPPDHF